MPSGRRSREIRYRVIGHPSVKSRPRAFGTLGLPCDFFAAVLVQSPQPLDRQCKEHDHKRGTGRNQEEHADDPLTRAPGLLHVGPILPLCIR